jgi:hypothetical protein
MIIDQSFLPDILWDRGWLFIYPTFIPLIENVTRLQTHGLQSDWMLVSSDSKVTADIFVDHPLLHFFSGHSGEFHQLINVIV